MKAEIHYGYEANEYPARFWLDDIPLTVLDIEDRWYGESCSYFRVFAEDGKTYLLRQDLRRGAWTLSEMKGRDGGIASRQSRVNTITLAATAAAGQEVRTISALSHTSSVAFWFPRQYGRVPLSRP